MIEAPGRREQRPRTAPTEGWSPDPPLSLRVILVVPLALLLGLLFVLPLAGILWTAFSMPSFSLQHFREFFESQAALHASATTARISAIVTAIDLLVGTLIAWELRFARSRGKQFLLWAAVLFPLWTSIVVRMYAFTIILEREGLVNAALRSLHIVGNPLPLLYTDAAVTLGMLYALLPYTVMPLYATFVNIDEDLIRAAESLGASRFGAFRSVAVPLALQSFVATAAIVFVIAIGYFVTPVMLGGPSSAFLATRINQQAFVLFDFPGAAATGSVLIVAAIVIVGLVWKAVGFERIQRSIA